MKKRFLSVSILMTCSLLAACSKTDGSTMPETIPETVEGAGQSLEGESQPSEGAGQSLEGGSQPLEGAGQSLDATASGESGAGTSGQKDASLENGKDSGIKDAGKEGEYFEETETVTLSDQILGAGDTMSVLHPTDDDPENLGLDITLKEAGFYGSPEEASLDRAQMEEQTENYDVSGNPEWCGIEEGRLLVCDMTVKNVNANSGDEQHISEIMIAYADPDTGKVTIVSCAPAYLSASSSQVGASDYYHYQLSKGESKEIRVAWLIQKKYEPENLYLCVTYDAKEPGERQYFQLAGE